MRRVPILRLASAVGLALLIAGCGTATDSPEEPAASPSSVSSESPTPSSPPVPSPTGPIATLSPGAGSLEKATVTGLLEEGVEAGCLVITDEGSGQVYTVTGTDLAERLGERVTVTGTVDPDMMSSCQQGAILLVEEVTPAPESQ